MKIEKKIVHYEAKGVCLGEAWMGGIIGYKSRRYRADSLHDLEKQILDGISDGSIDSGFGFRKVIGAVMEIRIVEVLTVDGKDYKHVDSYLSSFGEIPQDVEDSLMDCTTHDTSW